MTQQSKIGNSDNCKTAVEWLIEQRNKYGLIIMQDLEQAKAMEKEHLEDCWIAAEQSKDSQTFFNYYNETYNK